ncbi:MULTISPECIES: electron transport complex subunit RsxA [unclassified Anaerobiospirillum]|uniref:electron transport complex subunit RsxA n=1 Tax=unclassified Anaerobiospirillum TaxID=2647410 RepID=UPI001FF4AFFF|nr:MULTISPECIES: electron transport complex subunit RsxA [unclassified Anaerobiospirillum]MCK0526009.1 electron transport complex subunit RsxA [Anaerobiospirillum sp. NML120449]MCK0535045.1 electron transport complex subunit RsxA [Anaerobiospirillum sp. NML120511]MCK0540170.1 electron transport complex subunit RsxA [Anaerobiospirillum sp. NML02-A-032]
MIDALILFFSAAIVNNFVLVRFLGICPFIGVSSQLSAALGMGGATTFVLVLSALICTLANNYVLGPLGLTSLDLIVDIIIIAVAVQSVEIIIRKTSYNLYQALGIYLPLITSNCIVLGLVLLNSSLNHSLLSAMVYALGAGAGFTLVLTLFAAMRERLVLNDVPAPFQGTAIALISAGLMSLAFMGFAGFTGSSV